MFCLWEGAGSVEVRCRFGEFAALGCHYAAGIVCLRAVAGMHKELLCRVVVARLDCQKCAKGVGIGVVGLVPERYLDGAAELG